MDNKEIALRLTEAMLSANVLILETAQNSIFPKEDINSQNAQVIADSYCEILQLLDEQVCESDQ
ncbi:hypothetical protein [Anaerotruncus colihominis]|uniref:Uncharacterized protein n=1 Tax=Anaerotruncus colihominis TaxID=169435 RepID=A0A1Y4MDL8_9FIRM|nr:hypothetical protein [Anaerotruncus colihominis]NBI80059.1 hypothetical protein [Anaerotruncus colihominis]OUP65591.1 hypothetical protein B5F11_19720 [Anaerotruncus colihominis]OUP69710.1 hypothetical protein B5F10_19675 [Anaerotruncus colihominis]UWN73935.1 hypothetical protein NQ528_12020 [Anaerotruncus colihominis]